MKKLCMLLMVLCSCFVLVNGAEAISTFVTLCVEGDGCMDDATTQTDGFGCLIFLDSDDVCLYRYESSSSATETAESPCKSVVQPQSGTGRWILSGFVAGYVDAAGEYTETDTDVNVTVSGNSHTYFNNHASAITYNLPADVEVVSGKGKMFCFRNLLAQAMTVNPDDADYFNYNTDGAMAMGEALVSTGAIGEMLCVQGMNDGSNDYWVTFGMSGVWAQETPP